MKLKSLNYFSYDFFKNSSLRRKYSLFILDLIDQFCKLLGLGAEEDLIDVFRPI